MLKYKSISRSDLNSPNAYDIAVNIDQQNAQIYQDIRITYRRILEDTESIFGKDSKQYKYMDKIFIHSPTSAVSVVESFTKQQTEKQKKELALEHAKMLEVAQEEKVQRAVIFLLNKGKTLGTDFFISTAINDATNIVAEDARKEMEGKTVEIQCCNECSQWTVGEHRCSCGNRRMYWEFDGDFEHWSLNPQAD
jgi:hypothetical protein